jgi:hypothetical protein
MASHKFDEILLEKLADAVINTKEIKASSLQAICLAKDSEILKLEAKIDQLNAKLREIHLNSSRVLQKMSVGVQISQSVNSEELSRLHQENQDMAKKIQELEKNLFRSELKCIEMNQMIKSCYNEVELFDEPDEEAKNKHRVISVIETEIKSKHRSNSQEDKITPGPASNKLSLMNFINYKSKLTENPKTPTQKTPAGPYNFQSSGKKGFRSPVHRYN